MKTKSSVWSFTAIKPGSLRWKYETGDWIDSSPAIGEDGTVYVGSEDGFFYAIKSEAKD
jgi:outer membrane protein assembly factor BamB